MTPLNCIVAVLLFSCVLCEDFREKDNFAAGGTHATFERPPRTRELRSAVEERTSLHQSGQHSVNKRSAGPEGESCNSLTGFESTLKNNTHTVSSLSMVGPLSHYHPVPTLPQLSALETGRCRPKGDVRYTINQITMPVAVIITRVTLQWITPVELFDEAARYRKRPACFIILVQENSVLAPCFLVQHKHAHIQLIKGWRWLLRQVCYCWAWMIMCNLLSSWPR